MCPLEGVSGTGRKFQRRWSGANSGITPARWLETGVHLRNLWVNGMILGL